MSLINDALKRAQNAGSRPQPRATGPVLVPAVESLPRSRPRRPLGLALAGCALVTLISAGGIWLVPATRIQRNDAFAPNHAATPTKNPVESGPPQLVAAAPVLRPPPPRNLPDRTTPSAPTAAISSASLTRPPAVVEKPLPKKASIPFVRQQPSPAPSNPSDPARIAAVEAKSKPSPSAFHLDAIHYRLKKPTAEINHTTLRVGQEIDGAKVMAIERHQVRLRISGEMIVLSQL